MTARAKRLKRKSTVRRKRDPIPWKYCLLTMVCGLFLVAGFFYAARQHFSSMSIGMENAELRKEIKKLEGIERNLKLKKEISLSPGEIKKAAKKLGLQTMTARNIEVKKTSDNSTPKSVKESELKNDEKNQSKPTKRSNSKDNPTPKKAKKTSDSVKAKNAKTTKPKEKPGKKSKDRKNSKIK